MGYLSHNLKYDASYVRCVRGGQTPGPILIDNGNGTVTDSRTGLIWQQAEPGAMTWGSALSYCEGLSLGLSTSWRLPNTKELESLVDDTRYSPAIDTSKFPNAHASYYWSSTTYARNPILAWHVYFVNGYVGNHGKGNAFYVRCVRGGRSGPFGSLIISPSEHDFVSVDVGADSDPQTFTVTNTGTTNLTITATAITGPNDADFLVRNNLCADATLAPLGTCTLDAVFVPTAIAPRTADLTVASGMDPATVAALTGAGTAPDTIPPTGSIKIKNGAGSTNKTAVTLNLLAEDTGGSGLGSMRCHNGGVAAWGAWEPFATTKAWTLTGGAGIKTVYVQFRDRAGSISDSNPAVVGAQPYKDTIRYTGL